MTPSSLGCRICYMPQGWRDYFLYGICPYCWIGHHADKIISLIPVKEVAG